MYIKKKAVGVDRTGSCFFSTAVVSVSFSFLSSALSCFNIQHMSLKCVAMQLWLQNARTSSRTAPNHPLPSSLHNSCWRVKLTWICLLCFCFSVKSVKGSDKDYIHTGFCDIIKCVTGCTEKRATLITFLQTTKICFERVDFSFWILRKNR